MDSLKKNNGEESESESSEDSSPLKEPFLGQHIDLKR